MQARPTPQLGPLALLGCLAGLAGLGGVTLGDGRRAQLGLGVPVFGRERRFLGSHFVGERVALQPGDLVQSLADFARANGELLTFGHMP